MDFKRYLKILKRLFTQKNYIKSNLLIKIAPFISDRKYLEIVFPMRVGYDLNLDSPKTYNEKLQWLKLYDHNPLYCKMVDKIEAKKYVTEVLGTDEFIIPTLAVYDSVDEIDFDALPEQFVLKCSHDSGGIVICRDKSNFNKKRAIQMLKRGMDRNYYYQNREWPYKSLKPRIIAEQYMEDESGELKDYKIFCFNGDPKAMFIASDRFDNNQETKFDFYDMDFKHLPFTNGHPNSTKEIEKPDGFEKMKELAAKLSQGIPHARVDFYDIKGKIYFGEITFFHWSGMKPFKPIEWDYTFGSWIQLPEKKNNNG